MLPKSAFFVPFSRSQKGLKMGLGGDSWGGDKWVDNSCKHRPL